MNDDPIHCRTYLGHVLNIGDSVLGLDLKNSNVNNPELEKLSADKVGFSTRVYLGVMWEGV